ncbi:MAG TPA: hypothetical protein DDX14_09340 [Cyanobacteria bacterium UBA9579]|nr:hypothetical protein [Cyanobacteria bacterium UBA9579]
MLHIYLTENNKLYYGYTDDLDKKFQSPSSKASKFTRANKPLRFVYTKEYQTKSETKKTECRIKI